jgi:parallel beta-helix repeat protein
MKKHGTYIPALFGALFAGLILLLGSCMDLLNPTSSPGEGGPVPAGKGRLVIGIDAAARTALPSEAFDSYKLSFLYEGNEGYSHDNVDWSEGLTVDLEPGEWTISVKAYVVDDDSPILSGTGSKELTVSAGDNEPVTLRITTIYTGEEDAGTGIKGTFRLTVRYPADEEGVHEYAPGDISIFPVACLTSPAESEDIFANFRTANNDALEEFVDQICNNKMGTIDLDPGEYGVMMSIRDGIGNTRNTRMEMVHIYGGRETGLALQFQASEFTAAVPVSGTAQYSFPSVDPDPTVASRTIKAYTNEDCSSLLSQQAPVNWDAGNFDLQVPAGFGSVYLRQELTLDDGLVVGGRAWMVDFSSSVSRTVNIDDEFYKLILPPGIRCGTISNGTTYTAEGANVYLSLKSGFVLKKEIEYSYVNEDGIPNYGYGGVFLMPEADVTVAELAIYANPIRYVTANGAGDKDGSSWEHASNDLQKMMDELDYLRGQTDIEVSGPFIVKAGAGTYRPKYKPKEDGTTDYTTAANDRDSAFILRAGVQILGGYPAAGGDTRDITANPTILSGDLAGNDSVGESGDVINNTENACHVALGVNIPAGSGTVLDGFTITGGNANGSDNLSITVNGNTYTIPRNEGGGIYNASSSPALTDVTISGNTSGSVGGGIYNYLSSPALANVTISGNEAEGSGGGIYNTSSSSPVLTDCIISGNEAGISGGGIYNNSSSPVLTNVTISGNEAEGSGGGIYNTGSSLLVLTGVTIRSNTASNDGGGIFNNGLYLPPVLVNVNILGNIAETGNGGGIYNNNSSPVLINVRVSGNFAQNGGGLYNINASGSPALINVTIAGNKASGSGGGIYNSGSGTELQIRNSIIWGNTPIDPGIYNDSATPLISYSIVEGAGSDAANGNQDVNPGFEGWIDPSAPSWEKTENGHYNLVNGSLAINAGDNDLYYDSVNGIFNDIFDESLLFLLSPAAKTAIDGALVTDLAGNSRKVGAIDMGAYEKE